MGLVEGKGGVEREKEVREGEEELKRERERERRRPRRLVVLRHSNPMWVCCEERAKLRRSFSLHGGVERVEEIPLQEAECTEPAGKNVAGVGRMQPSAMSDVAVRRFGISERELCPSASRCNTHRTVSAIVKRRRSYISLSLSLSRTAR